MLTLETNLYQALLKKRMVRHISLSKWGYHPALITCTDRVSIRRSSPNNPDLADANKKLAEAVTELKKVCDKSTSVVGAPLQFDKSWAEDFILELKENKQEEDMFASALQRAVKNKSQQNEAAITGQIQGVLQKVAPIAEVALGVGEYVDEVCLTMVEIHTFLI